MAFSISPSVLVREFDNSGIIPAVSSTAAAAVGATEWGPAFERYLIPNETRFVDNFGYPNDSNFEDWFSAANFLLYGDTLYFVRAVNTTDSVIANRASNANSNGSPGVMVLNDDEYFMKYNDSSLDTLYNSGPWVAKYVGDKGNSLKVSVCQSAKAFSRTISGTLSSQAGSRIVTGTGTKFTTELKVNDFLVLDGEHLKISSIESDTSLTLHLVASRDLTDLALVVTKWEYFNEVDVSPNTSTFVENKGGRDDEIHVVVIDALGKFTGQIGEVLESFGSLSKAKGAKLDDGNTNYYVDAINQRSRYIRWASHDPAMTNAGSQANGTVFAGAEHAISYQLSGGLDGAPIGNAEKMKAFDLFSNGEEVDISILIAGNAQSTLFSYLIQNLAEKRMDCIAVGSPRRIDCIDNRGKEALSIASYRSSLIPNSSYGFMDNNWKYCYDKYNDTHRWVPINADVAGLIAQTDVVRDPWWSPAGFNRGNIRNVVKLAWNAAKTDRDVLYKVGVNSVCTFPNLGTVLYGDKTLLTKPSAFDRINVRRLFIVLEKAIATAAKFYLFEINDEFTQLQFRNMVEPYLRDIKGRRGIYDFRVICDNTVNTPEVIDRNEFIARIRIKPARSINFIYLDFVADRTSADFSETVGTY